MRLIFCETILALCSISFQTEVRVEEYRNITLVCPNTNLQAFQFAIWYRNDVSVCSVLPDCTHSCIPELSNMTLRCSDGQINNTLINVTRQNHGETWRCLLLPDGITEEHFNITVVVPISSVQITEPTENNLTVIENREISLVCETSFGFPAGNIKWYKGTSFIHSNITTSDINDSDSYLIQTKSTLTIIPDQSDKDKTIMCTANNTGTIKRSTNKTITDVHYPVSVLTFKANRTPLNGSDLKVIVGSQLNVQCVSDGNPSTSFSWIRPDATPTTHGAFVNFTNVQEQNDGSYTCKATNTMVSINEHIVSTNNSILNVMVLVPTTKPLFYFLANGRQKLIVNNSVYVIRNDNTFTIKCNASGNPMPSCTLSSAGTCVQAFTNVAEDRNIICTTSNELNTTLTGVVHRMQSSLLSIVTMYEPEKPHFKYLNSRLNISTIKVRANSSITITCVSESYPQPGYKWTGSDGQISSNKTLILTSILVDKQGENLTCMANNTMSVSFGGTYNGYSTASILLDVLYSPTIPLLRINDVTLNGSIKIIRGDNVTITCSSDGNPSPTLLWQYNWQAVGPTLHLMSIQRNVTHMCKATNTLNPTFLSKTNETSSKSIMIEVQYPPESITIDVIYESDSVKHEQNNTHIRVLNGLTFNLTCQARSSPLPHKIEWKLKTTLESTHVEFFNVSENSTGIYMCTVFNKMFRTVGPAEDGTGHRSVYLLVISTDKPEAPSQLVAVMQSVSTITVEWKPGLPGSSPQHFVVSYSKRDSDDWVEENVNDTNTAPDTRGRSIRYTIKNLASDTTYYIQIMAINSFGTSDNAALIVRTEKADGSYSNHTSAIIGGSFAALLVLFGGIFSIFIYRKRFVKGKESEKSTDQNVTYENMKIEQIPITPLGNQVDASTDQAADNAYEGLSRQDVDNDSGYTDLGNASTDVPDATLTYENLKIQLSSCHPASGMATDI